MQNMNSYKKEICAYAKQKFATHSSYMVILMCEHIIVVWHMHSPMYTYLFCGILNDFHCIQVHTRMSKSHPYQLHIQRGNYLLPHHIQSFLQNLCFCHGKSSPPVSKCQWKINGM